MEWEQQSLDGQFGKTFLEHIAQTKEKISESLSKNSVGLRTVQLQFLSRIKENGLEMERSWEMVGQLPGVPWTLNTGESPNAAVASTLSQILQDNPHPKYFLSAAAVTGILRRASKRGKKLPEMLRKALEEQSGLRRDTYGQTEIANTGALLRDMRSAFGEEAFEEWVRGATDVFYEKEILFLEMFGDCTVEEDAEPEGSKVGETSGKENNPSPALCALWKVGVHGSPPQGRESVEQFARELGSALQELSRQTAPYEVFLRCLRSSYEGTWPLYETLASLQKSTEERMGHSIHEDATGCAGGAVFNESGQGYWMPGFGCLRAEGENRPSRPGHVIKGRLGDAGVAWSVDTSHADDVVRIDENVVPALQARGHKGGNNVCIPINTQVTTRWNKMGEGTGMGIASDGDPAYTLQAGHEHAVAFCVGESPDVAHCLRAGASKADKHESTTYVCTSLYENHGHDSRLVGPLDVSPTVATKYGTGGNNTSLVTACASVAPTIPARERGGGGLGTDFDCDGGLVMAHGQANAEIVNDGCPALTCNHEQPILFQPPSIGLDEEKNGTVERYGTLEARKDSGGFQGCVKPNNSMRVRRLTPLECERLQGFPDGWTDIPGASDSGRYKALGNSLAIPTAEYVIEGIAYCAIFPKGAAHADIEVGSTGRVPGAKIHIR